MPIHYFMVVVLVLNDLSWLWVVYNFEIPLLVLPFFQIQQAKKNIFPFQLTWHLSFSLTMAYALLLSPCYIITSTLPLINKCSLKQKRIYFVFTDFLL